MAAPDVAGHNHLVGSQKEGELPQRPGVDPTDEQRSGAGRIPEFPRAA